MGLFSRSEPASHFPRVRGKRLDDTDVRFPQDLPADATLLVVSFRDDLDPLADQWARLGDRLADVHGDRIATVETPVVNRKLKLLGGLATLGIRGQVQSEEEKDRTVPIFVDVKAFRKELGLKDSGDVYAFLVARDGRIAWRGEGEIDMDEVDDLEAAVQEVLDAPVPSAQDHPDAEANDMEDEAESARPSDETVSEESDEPDPAAGKPAKTPEESGALSGFAGEPPPVAASPENRPPSPDSER